MKKKQSKLKCKTKEKDDKLLTKRQMNGKQA